MIDATNQFSKIDPLFNYLKKQRENEKFIKSLEIGATFFLISFFLLVAIKPTIFAISSRIGEIKSKRELTKSMRGKINNVIMAQGVFSEVQGRYQVIDTSLPDRPHYSHVASQIIQPSSNTGTQVEKILFDTEKVDQKSLNKKDKIANQQVKPVNVNFSVESDFSSIVKFVSALMDSRRLFEIDSITFSPAKKDKSGQDVSNKVTMGVSTNVLFWNPTNEKK